MSLPSEEVQATDVQRQPHDVAAVAHGDLVVGIDVSGDTPQEIARYPTDRQADTVAVERGGRTIWVTGTADGVVQGITR